MNKVNGNSNHVTCQVCLNTFNAMAPGSAMKGHCPFCQTGIAPGVDNRSLDEIIGFKVQSVLDWQTPAKVYVAQQAGRKFLVTLLDEKSRFYSHLKGARDGGQSDPYNPPVHGSHPDLICIYPIVWKGDVAVVVMDYMDGKSLAEWIYAVGTITVPDAVSIAVKSLRLAQALGPGAPTERIDSNSIQVFDSGAIKFTSHAGVFFRQFRAEDDILSPTVSLEKSQQRLEKLKRFSITYFAPEYNSQNYNKAEYSLAQLQAQDIYCLGALLYELLADHAIPKIEGDVQLVERFECVPVHKLRPDVPILLSQIIQRMTAFHPAERYQTYDEVIAALEGLGVATETVSFVERREPAAARVEALNKAQWQHRTETEDFRKVKWGMTHDQVRQLESDCLSRVMPVAIWITTEYNGLKLGATYQFLMDNYEPVCIGASIMPSSIDFMKRDESTLRARMDELNAKIRQLSEDDPKGLNFGEIEKLIEQQMASINSEDITERIRKSPGQLDVPKLLDAYQTLKKLISTDYGTPMVEDGPVQEDPAFVNEVAKSDGLELEKVLLHCQSTIWQTERTYATLNIIPGPMHSRLLVARFWSLNHRHLFPQ